MPVMQLTLLTPSIQVCHHAAVQMRNRRARHAASSVNLFLNLNFKKLRSEGIPMEWFEQTPGYFFLNYIAFFLMVVWFHLVK